MSYLIARVAMVSSYVLWSVIVAACGHASQGDHPDPASASDASAAPVTVVVTVGAQPIAGVHVYFVNADGSPVATVDTDATGTAQAIMQAGGSVTAIDPFPVSMSSVGVAANNNFLATIMAVKPGDRLVMHTRDVATAEFNITLRAPIETNATGYTVLTTCGDGSLGRGQDGVGPSGLVGLFACNGAADIAIVSHGASGVGGVSNPISGLYHPNAAVAADGVVDLTAEAYKPLVPVTFTYVNAPSAPISVEHSLRLPHGQLGPFSATVTAGTATSLEPMLPAGTSVVSTLVELTGDHQVIEAVPVTTSYTLDLKDVLLPEIPARPSFDVATGRASWTEGTIGATPDVAVDTISVVRGEEPSRRHWQWAIAAPYKRGELAFPKLPTDVFDWTPTAGDHIGVGEVTIAQITGGYDALRGRLFGDSNISVAAGERLVSSTSPH